MMREEVAFALVKCPRFAPEDGDTREAVFEKLRNKLAKMRKEWWGGEELYRRMEQLISDADSALNANDEVSALRAFGEIYKILDQTPRPNHHTT